MTENDLLRLAVTYNEPSYTKRHRDLLRAVFHHDGPEAENLKKWLELWDEPEAAAELEQFMEEMRSR